MKRVLCAILSICVIIGTTACGDNNNSKVADNRYKNVEECAIYAIEELKGILKNPSSFIANNLYAVETGDSYIFDIDYSAENGFGGMNRNELFLEVYSIEKGFAVRTYGFGTFAEEDNQKYSCQQFEKYDRLSGKYIFDTENYRVSEIDTSGIDTSIDQRVELVGGMKGANTGFDGAWNFKVGDDPYLKVVYFKEGTDLSWYEQFTGFPYEITISAVKDEDGHYHDAVVIEDTIRYATVDEHFQRFNSYDRKILVETIPTSGLEPLTSEAIKNILDDKTFSMRNNYGGDVDGTHSITFHSDGNLDANYIASSDGNKYSMYESWKIEKDTVVLTHTYDDYGKSKTTQAVFDVYQLDDTRILLINNGYHDGSMALTTKQ